VCQWHLVPERDVNVASTRGRLHNHHYAARRSRLPPVQNIGLIEAFERFQASLRAAQKSPNTVAAYHRDLRMVAELLVGPLNLEVAEMRLSNVTVPVLREAFGLRAETSSPATMARTHSVWTRFFRFARSDGLTTATPMDDIEKVRQPTHRPRSIDSPDLARRLLAAAAEPPDESHTRWPTRDVALVTLLVATGIRLAELVDLHCQSITGEPGAFQLDVVGKGSKYRSIPLLDQTVDRINTYQAERRDRFPRHRLDRRTTPLFVHPATGDAITRPQVQYLIDRLYREAGMRAQVPPGALVHALRHSFAMDLLDTGASIVEVQTLLGHESISTTRRYLTARPHELRDAIQATAASRSVIAGSAGKPREPAPEPRTAEEAPAEPPERKIRSTAKKWACELVTTEGPTRAVVWSAHTSEAGAKRMIASLQRPWQLQGHELRQRWQWKTAPLAARQPLHTTRQQALESISGKICFDRPPDLQDLVVESRPNPPASPHAPATVDIIIQPTGTSLGRHLGRQQENYTVLDIHGQSSHGAYLQPLLNLLFAPRTEAVAVPALGQVRDDIHAAISRVAGGPGQPWTVPTADLRRELIATGQFINLAELET